MKNNHFYLMVTAIVVAGTLLRIYNVNYASLWADELYSVLAVRPGNSWYEILYMQRAYQPPAYFMLLWVWTKAFGFDEFSVRLLSVIGGVLCIAVSAWLGRVVLNARLGILMALIVAFNPVQIWYSLEVRFYVFVYFFAALSILLYWQLRRQKPRSAWLYLFKGSVDATLCYFHHFGIVFVFAQGVFDLFFWKQERDGIFLRKMFMGYLFAALLYLPWVLWGLTEGLAVKQYWLKENDLLQFLRFNFGYPNLVTYTALAMVAWFVVVAIRQKRWLLLLFPFIVALVTLVPFLYSVIRFPILVDRYAMVLAPLFYLMLGFSILHLAAKLQDAAPVPLAKGAHALVMAAFCFWGLHLSLVDRAPLVKQPWRELAEWVKKQPDYGQVPVYSLGTQVKGLSNIDFYLDSQKPSVHLDRLVPGRDAKMYLVETSGIWQIRDSVWQRVDSFYNRRKLALDPAYPGTGNIYICERKNNTLIALRDSAGKQLNQWTAR
ncbi:glycosyltransferase family 39 protein [Flavisolibacter sp. BT320]|nr:glycosyltransferase family 39 protein [Flavisolibacter longurius]